MGLDILMKTYCNCYGCGEVFEEEDLSVPKFIKAARKAGWHIVQAEGGNRCPECKLHKDHPQPDPAKDFMDAFKKAKDEGRNPEIVFLPMGIKPDQDPLKDIQEFKKDFAWGEEE